MTLLTRIKKRADWELHKAFDAIYRRFVKSPCVMTYGQCVDYVLANRASICRFGDGELGVIRGRTLGFQMHDGCLGDKLRQILMADVEGLLICIPDTFERLERYNPVEIFGKPIIITIEKVGYICSFPAKVMATHFCRDFTVWSLISRCRPPDWRFYGSYGMGVMSFLLKARILNWVVAMTFSTMPNQSDESFAHQRMHSQNIVRYFRL